MRAAPALCRLACLLAFAGIVAAQDDVIFRLDTQLVLLQVSVLDKKGNLVTDLPQTAFTVYENNQPQPIRLFKREDVPVSMGLLIDNSGSMRNKKDRVAAAAKIFVEASNPQDEMMIVNFNDMAYIDQDLTSDRKKLEEALDRIDARQGTAAFDAISLTYDWMKTHAKKDKKVLLIITDGADNASEIKLEQLLRKVQRTDGVLIYCVGILSEEEPTEARRAKRALKELAEGGGGLEFYPKDLAEVEKVTPQIAKEIRNQYVIGYSPTNQNFDGAFRTVRVAVKGAGNPTARTRTGYYATPEGKDSVATSPAPAFPAPAKK